MAGLRMPTPSELGGLATQRAPRRAEEAAPPPPEEEAAAPSRPLSPPPGEVLHEVVVGVDPSCEWRPFQAPPPPPCDIEAAEGDDSDASLLLLERSWRQEEKLGAEAGYRYALALMA